MAAACIIEGVACLYGDHNRRFSQYTVYSINRVIDTFFSCRAETEHMLIDARHRQIQNKEHVLAVQAQRDRTEFERLLQ